MTAAQGAALATYVVGEVKAIDPNCGGPTQVAMIATNKAAQMDASTIEDLQRQVGKIAESSWETFKKRLRAEWK